MPDSELFQPQEDAEPTLETEHYHHFVEELDRDFELQELREAIFYHIKFNKSSGPDGISDEILKWD